MGGFLGDHSDHVGRLQVQVRRRQREFRRGALQPGQVDQHIGHASRLVGGQHQRDLAVHPVDRLGVDPGLALLAHGVLARRVQIFHRHQGRELGIHLAGLLQ
ncbi:hypothetical protein D9M69_521990 [compost metagenome]